MKTEKEKGKEREGKRDGSITERKRRGKSDKMEDKKIFLKDTRKEAAALQPYHNITIPCRNTGSAATPCS